MNEPTQEPFDQFNHFAGFDWASEHHHIVIVDGSGDILFVRNDSAFLDSPPIRTPSTPYPAP